nr:DUF58 domain-containing protein [uncultured Bacillus sp.]
MKGKFRVFYSVWKLLLLVILMLITFSYAMFQGRFVSWFLFYSFLPLALYACCLAFYPIDSFSLERELPKREFHANEPLTIKVRLKRNSIWPLLLLIVEDQLGQALSAAVFRKGNKVFLFPGFRREFTFSYQIEQLPRGEHELSSLRVVTSDILGFIQREAELVSNDKILVYPAYAKGRYKPLENEWEQGTVSVNNRMQQDTTMTVGVREYRPGDRLSWINWKASAKRSEFMMKEFEQRRSQDLMLILDCAPHSLFEFLVQYTASIGQDALRKGARAGLMALSDQRILLLPTGGKSSHKQLLYQLAKVKDQSPLTFAQALKAERHLLQQKAVLLLVTAQISVELIEAVQMFATRKCRAQIFVVKQPKEKISANEISMVGMAEARRIGVQFVNGPPLATGLEKEVTG